MTDQPRDAGHARTSATGPPAAPHATDEATDHHGETEPPTRRTRPHEHAWMEVTTHADHNRVHICATCQATREEPR